jgi:hypothetical protein
MFAFYTSVIVNFIHTFVTIWKPLPSIEFKLVNEFFEYDMGKTIDL